ncbi:MAG: MBL fold metallo-hydrolase [Lachnospiraceae bacterium]|nr:MBL fold metallo-hydrolase [Lachnospiraceae bacterium]
MARRRRRRRNNGLWFVVPVFAAFMAVVLPKGLALEEFGVASEDKKEAQEKQEDTGQAGVISEALQKEEGVLTITYLDVGQADCTILQWQEYAMLIDAGNDADAALVLTTLERLGIEQLDYVIATHSHEDHIGAMDEVLWKIPTECLIYPEETSEMAVYLDFLEAAERVEKRLVPHPGEVYELGALQIQVLAPHEGFRDNPNNASVAVRLVYGENSFVFTGDAEAESEMCMLEFGMELESDVLQAGHHGSSTSNTEAFLEAVDPVYVIISCEKDNAYGHPHSEVLARLEEMDVQVYRTDTMGTITLVSDGKNIKISTE